MRLTCIILILFSCNSSSKQASEVVAIGKLSKAQITLWGLCDMYKIDYINATSDIEKGQITTNYQKALLDFCFNNSLDSIEVSVIDVTKSNNTITTKLHSHEIEFDYGLTFQQNMPQKIDSLYNWMTTLKPGVDTIVSFSFTGACEVNDPTDKNKPIFRIFAFPLPLTFKTH